MQLVVATPPEPIVSLVEAKAQCRVAPENTDDDGLLADLVAVATGSLDGPDGWLGRALGRQELDLLLPGFECRPIALPCPPVASLVSVASVDPDGSVWTYDPATYRLETDRILRRAPEATWRATADRQDAVRIRYAAGWETTPASGESPLRWTGPAPIRHAVLMMVTRLYQHRGEDQAANLVEDRAVRALLGPWRVLS